MNRMNPWTRTEAHDLVDALLDAGRLDADTAVRAHDLVDRGRPTAALELVERVAL